MDIQANRIASTPNSPPSLGSKSPSTPSVCATAPKIGDISRIDFQNMTVGEYVDTLNYLCHSGQITHEELLDIYVTCIPPTAPCATQAEHLDMPMRISYERLRGEVVELASAGRLEDRDRHQRVLDLLIRLDGNSRGVDTVA